MENTNVYVAFHVGRGGRFYNAGHKTFIGEMTFADLVSLRSEYLFERNRDEKGRFCKPYLTDSNGNLITDDDMTGNTGRLEFDMDYDTDYVKEVNDCTDHEIEVIANTNCYKGWDLVKFLEKYSNENELGWEFDKYGCLQMATA